MYACIHVQYELSGSIPCTSAYNIISPRPAGLYGFIVYTLGQYILHHRQSNGHWRSFLCSIKDNMF